MEGEAVTVPYSKYGTGCRYPLSTITQSRDYGMGNPGQARTPNLVQLRRGRSTVGSLLRNPGISITHTGDTDPGPCIWQAPRVLFSNQSRPPASCLSGLAAHLGVPSLSVDPPPQWPLGPKRRRAAVATSDPSKGRSCTARGLAVS